MQARRLAENIVNFRRFSSVSATLLHLIYKAVLFCSIWAHPKVSIGIFCYQYVLRSVFFGIGTFCYQDLLVSVTFANNIGDTPLTYA